MFNTFLKNILKYYCSGYRRTTSFGIFQRVEKELLQISLLLLTLWHNYRWYSIGDIIFTNIYIVRKIKVPDRIAYGIPSVIWQTSREKYRRNEVDKFFCVFYPFVNPSVNLLLIDPKLMTRVFLMDCFCLWACR